MLADTIRKLNAEASYFVTQDGLRCALIFFDMKDSAELPAIAEPLFTSQRGNRSGTGDEC